jgi:hypothetical protein
MENNGGRMSDPMSGSARDKLDRINKSMRTTMTKFHLPQILLPKLGAEKDAVVEKDYQGEGEMEGLGAVMHLRSHVKGSLHAPGSPMHVPALTQDVEKSEKPENFPGSSLAMRMSPLSVNGDASELAEKDSEASRKAWESRQRAKEEAAGGGGLEAARRAVAVRGAKVEEGRKGAVQSAKYGLGRVDQAIADFNAENFDNVIDSVKRASGEMASAQTYAERMGDTESAKKFGAAYRNADDMYTGKSDPTAKSLGKLRDQIKSGMDGVKAFKAAGVGAHRAIAEPKGKPAPGEKPAAKPEAVPEGKWKQNANRMGEAGIRLYDANSKMQNRIVLGVPYEYPDSPEGKKDKGYHRAFDIIYGKDFKNAIADASDASKGFWKSDAPPTNKEVARAREKAQAAKDKIQPLKAALDSSPKGDRIRPSVDKVERDLDAIISAADAISGGAGEKAPAKPGGGDWTPKDEKRANDEAARMNADKKKHGEREAQLRHRGRMGRMADAIGDPGKAEGRARKFRDAGMAEAATLFADRANQLRRAGKTSKSAGSSEDIAEEMQYDLWLKTQGESFPDSPSAVNESAQGVNAEGLPEKAAGGPSASFIVDQQAAAYADRARSEAGKKAWESRQRRAQQLETANINIAGMQRRAREKAEKDAPSGPVARLFVPRTDDGKFERQIEEALGGFEKFNPGEMVGDSDRSEAARRAWEKRGLQPGALSSDDLKLRQAGMDWFKKMKPISGVPGTVTRAMLSGVKGLKNQPEITPLHRVLSHTGTVDSATKTAQSVKASILSFGYKATGELKGKAYKGGHEWSRMFEHPSGQSVMLTIGTSEGKVLGQTPARLDVSHTINPSKYEVFISGRKPFVEVGKSLDYLEPMLEKEVVEKIFKASGFDKLPLTDKARGVIEDAISRGAVPSTEYTGKIMVEHAMPEEPPAYARPGKDGLKVGDRVIPLQWMSAGRFGATFDLPYIPEAMKVKKLFVGPAKVSKNAYPPGKAPGDLSKVETVTEDRLWGMELESEEVSKDGEELCPCPVVTKDTTMVLRLEPLAQPTGEVNPQ